MATDLKEMAYAIELTVDLLSEVLQKNNVSYPVGGAAMTILLGKLKEKHNMNFILVEAENEKPRLTLVKTDANSK